MGKGGCSKEGARIVLWMCYITVWLITSIYVALAVITFGKLWQAALEFNYGPTQLAKNKVWRAPLASLSLSAMLVFGFNFSCCIILIKKSVNRGGPGFSYGFMVAFSIALSFFLLLSGLVLDGFRPEVQSALEPKYDVNGTLVSGAVSWSSYSSEGFIGAEALSLISFCVYFLFGVVLILLQSAVNDQLGIAGGYTASAGAKPIPTADFKDGPAAPPDYEHYAQDQQYSSYVVQDIQQQYYDPNAGVFKPVGMPVDNNAGAGGYYIPSGYAAVDASSYQATQPPMYAAGFAAVGGYNAYSSTPTNEDAAMMQQQQQYSHAQQNQQI